jgi:hypothetical protein
MNSGLWHRTTQDDDLLAKDCIFDKETTFLTAKTLRKRKSPGVTGAFDGAGEET